MKALIKKPWFIGTVILGILVVTALTNLWILSLKLTASYEDHTIFTLASNLSDGFINVFAFVLRIVYYGSLLMILLSGISLLRKRSRAVAFSISYFLGMLGAFIIFQAFYKYMSTFAIILIIINILLIIGSFVLFFIRAKFLSTTEDSNNEKNLQLNATKIPLTVLIIDIISIVVFLTTFFIPLYALIEQGSTYYAIMINVVLSGDTRIELVIYFLVNFTAFLAIFLYFAQSISYYYFDKDEFIQKSNQLINTNFFATIVFFLAGLTINMIYNLRGDDVQTWAFIPTILMCIVIFYYAIARGKYNALVQFNKENVKLKYSRIEPLLYVIMLTAISVLMLLLPIVKIEIIFDAFTYDVNLTGFAILRDYATLEPGYRFVAYILVVMLISVGLTLILSISSYLSKYKQFHSIVKFATSINLFFVFLIAISGYYFQIGQEIDQSVMLSLFAFYGIGLPNDLDYQYIIGTQAMYALMAATLILIIMFFRKAFEGDNHSMINMDALPKPALSDVTHGSPSFEQTDDHFQTLDPCPAFTVLDNDIHHFKLDVEKRKTMKVSDPSLSDLVHFIVEYARNSRLHLSYTPEDIATFVAGLGATRLSILQGMSGTGKTSLPKIFSEAIYGNCDIIEVESSWKDKNELLGYYNEFSMKYTPKKFTLALYKAALNPEIVTFILLDEMNLSRIEYYFSDFLSLMENEEKHRKIKLINIRLHRRELEVNEDIEYTALEHGNTLSVPPNVWFIGTANRDESTFVISDKVYDRAHTMNFTKRAPKVRNYTQPIPQKYYDYRTINELFVQAKTKGDFDAENSEIIKQVEMLLSPFNISFGNRILKQIEDFVNIYQACFPKEDVTNKAIEKILLSKVVAKLEVKTIDDKEKLIMEFEKMNLNQCVEFIQRLDNE